MNTTFNASTQLIEKALMLDTLCALINAANTEILQLIYMSTAGAIGTDTPAGRIIATLLAAPARGVRLNAIMSSHERASQADRDNRCLYLAYVAAGAHCRITHPHHMQHSKLWIIDNQLVIDTSANMTNRAYTHNIEHMSVTRSTNYAIACANRWRQIWRQSTELTTDRTPA